MSVAKLTIVFRDPFIKGAFLSSIVESYTPQFAQSISQSVTRLFNVFALVVKLYSGDPLLI